MAAQTLKEKTYTRATFAIDPELLEKFKDYAYTERLSLRDALEGILSEFLKDKTELLPHK